MEVWAHRGRLIPGLPGNTLLDFQEAYELGIHGIETDVCFTAPDGDGSQEPIIHHPNPKDSKDPSYKKWSHLKFRPGIKILCLENFLAFLKVHSNLSCYLDIKQEDEKLVDVVVDRIARNELEERVYVTSLQTRIPWLGLETSGNLLLRTKARNPKIKTHLIAMFPFSLPAMVRQYNCDAISFGWLSDKNYSRWVFRKVIMRVVDLKSQISQVQDMGVKVVGGIANNREDFEYLAGLGVNGIMTDNSLAAMEFAKEKSP